MKAIVLILFFVVAYAQNTLSVIKTLSQTVHALQYEREISCKYVLSTDKNRNILFQLNNVCLTSDRQLKRLKEVIKRSNLDKNDKKHLEVLLAKLNKISSLRDRLKEGRLECKDVFLGYKDLISSLLAETSYLSEKCSFKDLVYQYVVLLMYEESVWQKKLEITAFLTTGNFKKIKDYYLMSVTKEKIYFQLLNKLLSNGIKKEWEKYVSSEEFKYVLQIENEIFEKYNSKEYKEKLRLYTKYIYRLIEKLHKIEDEIIQNVESKTLKYSIFTPQEINFINSHKPIKYVFDPNWKPFEFKDEIGQHQGIIADIIKIIKAKSGLNLVPVPVNSWKEAKEFVKSGKADMFSAISENEKRKKYLNFTKHTIYSYNAVIVGKKGDYYRYKNMNSFQGKKIGIKKGYVLIDYFRQNYPRLTLVEVPSIKDGFKLLSEGKIDFFVNNMVVANYYIHNLGFKNLQVVKVLNYKFKLKIAIRKDRPKIILEIIDKALASIPKDELNEIYYKWINSAQNRIDIQKRNISIKDLLPVKELLVIFVIFIIAVYFMLRYINNKANVAFGFSVFVFVSLFLFFIILVTVVSIKNLEKIKKAELGYSLSTILNTTHESIKKILLSQEKYLNMAITTGDKDELKKLKKLDFVDGYMILDPDLNILLSTFNIKSIESQNFIDGIKNSEKYGYTILFPVKNSPKELHKIFFIKTIYKDFKPYKIVAVAINKNIIQSVLDKGRMGHTGETYIVNRYKQMASQSRFDDELRKIGLIKPNQSSYLNIIVNTLASNDALRHHNGLNTDGYLDYRKMRVYGAWEWDNDYNIAIISEIDEKEAMQSFINSKTTIYYALFTVVAFVIILMIFIVWLSNRTKKELEKKNRELEVFNLELENLVKERTKSLEQAKKEIESIHQHTKDSIEFASLLQGALIPQEDEVKECFDDFFVIWKPKDIVGGDIWLFEKVREDECILMVIDCTGHGVPGAFVTMIVKAVEREIISRYKEHKELEISPAQMLKHFNMTIKKLLKQEDEKSLSNAGFDGGILYYNKKENIIKYSSARTPLFVVEKENVTILKGDRYSVGYKKNDKDYEYEEYELKIGTDIALYITTDGYIDQIGGKKCMPFGKKRLKDIIIKVKNLPMDKQKEIFEEELIKYQNECVESERLDDITLVGIKLKGEND